MGTRGTPLSTIAASAAMLLLAMGASARRVAAQQEFGQTRYWGSGLIDDPVAWVSPLSGDFSIQYAGTVYQTNPKVSLYNTSLNSQGSLDVSLFGRAEVGVNFYSSDPEQGFFGQVLLLSDHDFKTGPLSWLPALAVGVRNVGPYKSADRFNLGYGETQSPNGGSAPTIQLDSVHQGFNTGNTVYGVATKGFNLSDLRSSLPPVGISFTVGYGNGLFSNHGNVPVSQYAADATGGLFYGMRADYRPTTNTLVAFMAENNAWDFNAGGSFDWRGLRAGLFVTEIGAGSQKINAAEAGSAIWHYTKFAFTLGWHSNFFALIKGNFLENRAAQLTKQRNVLSDEIAKRQARIVELQGLVRQYEAQNLLELEQRRSAAQAELQGEQEALHRLEERLKRIETETQQGVPTQPSPTPPPTTPPHP
jgi:hypothetical protein